MLFQNWSKYPLRLLLRVEIFRFSTVDICFKIQKKMYQKGQVWALKIVLRHGGKSCDHNTINNKSLIIFLKGFIIFFIIAYSFESYIGEWIAGFKYYIIWPFEFISILIANVILRQCLISAWIINTHKFWMYEINLPWPKNCIQIHTMNLETKTFPRNNICKSQVYLILAMWIEFSGYD